MRRLVCVLSVLGGVSVAGGCTHAGRDGGAGAAVDGPPTDAVTWTTDVPIGCPAVPSMPICPPTPPQAGAPCPLADAKCEYASTPNIQCRVMWSCSSSQTWQLTSPGCASDSTCPLEADALAGAACVAPGWCAYADAYCTCGGAAGAQRWGCWPPPNPVCPPQLPVSGATCDRNGQECHYGGCFDYWAMCCGGSWVTGLPANCTE
jgi:hypothetical protein